VIPEPVAWMLLVLMACIVMGVPIAFSLILSTLPPLLMEPRFNEILLAQRIYKGLDSFVLLAVPFFLLAGNLMNACGVTDRLIRFADACVGHLRGGLAHVNVMVSMLFAGVSGSSTADTAGVGSVLIPAMKQKGFRASFAVSVTASSSVMGVIIPPSIILVVWGAVTNVSVAQLFAGGILPGILIGVSQMGYVSWKSRRDGMQPRPRANFAARKSAFYSASPAMLMPLIILGGVTFGVATPTEASIIAVAYALLLGAVVYRKLSPRMLLTELVRSSKLVALSLFCLGSAALFGWLLAYYGVPGALAEAASLAPNATTLLFSIALVCLILGMILDALVIAVIVGPLFMPAVLAAGIDPVHYGIVACIALSLGLITPPYGLCLLLASAIGGIEMHDALGDTMRIFLVTLTVLIAAIVAPGLTTFLAALVI